MITKTKKKNIFGKIKNKIKEAGHKIKDAAVKTKNIFKLKAKNKLKRFLKTDPRITKNFSIDVKTDNGIRKSDVYGPTFSIILDLKEFNKEKINAFNFYENEKTKKIIPLVDIKLINIKEPKIITDFTNLYYADNLYDKILKDKNVKELASYWPKYVTHMRLGGNQLYGFASKYNPLEYFSTLIIDKIDSKYNGKLFYLKNLKTLNKIDNNYAKYFNKDEKPIVYIKKIDENVTVKFDKNFDLDAFVVDDYTNTKIILPDNVKYLSLLHKARSSDKVITLDYSELQFPKECKLFECGSFLPKGENFTINLKELIGNNKVNYVLVADILKFKNLYCGQYCQKLFILSEEEYHFFDIIENNSRSLGKINDNSIRESLLDNCLNKKDPFEFIFISYKKETKDSIEYQKNRIKKAINSNEKLKEKYKDINFTIKYITRKEYADINNPYGGELQKETNLIKIIRRYRAIV